MPKLLRLEICVKSLVVLSRKKSIYIKWREIVVKEIFIQKSEALNWFKIAEKIKRQKFMKYL